MPRASRSAEPGVLIRKREADFLLWDWLNLQPLLDRPRFAGHDQESLNAVLELSTHVAEYTFLPINKTLDRNEPSLADDGSVRPRVDPAEF